MGNGQVLAAATVAVGLGAIVGVGDAVAGGVGEGAGVKTGVGLGAGVVAGVGLGFGLGVGLAAGVCGAVARKMQQALRRKARAINVFFGGVVFTINGNVMGGYEGFGRRSYKSLSGRQD